MKLCYFFLFYFLSLNNAGKQYDMMVYPDQNHSMRPTGMIHIRQKMVDYCLENL